MLRMASSGNEPSMITCVPVALIEVISGKDCRVRQAQFLGEVGLALEADPKRVGAELGQGKHLSVDLEHRGLGAERKRFLGSAKRQTVIAKLRGIHRPDVDCRCSTDWG
jgi:hypothetical protein